MAPMLGFDRDGRLMLVAGSPGGSFIINYVARTLVAILDWGLDPQAAVALPHYGSRNGPTELEAGTGAMALGPALIALGHKLTAQEQVSGLHVIVRRGAVIEGGADPRREGQALGD
jgi:gamma-glutamyltranspeptidase/glutathione hydrolase